MSDIVQSICASVIGVHLVALFVAALVLACFVGDRRIKAEKEFVKGLSNDQKALIHDYKMATNVPWFKGKKGKNEDGKGA